MVMLQPAAHPRHLLLTLPPQRMAVVESHGDPEACAGDVVPALLGAVYALKNDLRRQGRDFAVSALRARLPDVACRPRAEWTALWGLPVPPNVTAVPQKVPGVAVRIEVWDYGTVLEMVQRGGFAGLAGLRRLHEFAESQGYRLVGPYEEEYLRASRLQAPKVLIRCAVAGA